MVELMLWFENKLLIDWNRIVRSNLIGFKFFLYLVIFRLNSENFQNFHFQAQMIIFERTSQKMIRLSCFNDSCYYPCSLLFCFLTLFYCTFCTHTVSSNPYWAAIRVFLFLSLTLLWLFSEFFPQTLFRQILDWKSHTLAILICSYIYVLVHPVYFDIH